MRFDEFCGRIRDEIKPLLEDKGYSVEKVYINPVTKNNGITYSGMFISGPETNISPVIYLEPRYHQYMNGILYDDILDDIVATYENNLPKQSFNVSQVFDFEEAKNNIIYTLINYKENEKLLQTIPHKKIEDLAVIYKILLTDEEINNEMATITIRDEFFEHYNISLEELHEIAETNTKCILPAYIKDMSGILEETGFAAPWVEDSNMVIVSNEKKIYGAATILDPAVMNMLAERLGETFYVIPSSIHEVIVLPYEDDLNTQYLEDVIRDVNDTQLMQDEILSYKAYMVDAKEHKLFLAEKKEEYFKEKELQQQKMQKLQEEEKQQKPKGPKL